MYLWELQLFSSLYNIFNLEFVIAENVDVVMHFIYSRKYNTNSAEDSSDMVHD